MNARKILLWGIPILIVGLVIACVILGLVSQMTHQKAWATYTLRDSELVIDAIEVIAFDAQGRAWIGSRGSVNIFDEETWTTYTKDNAGLADGFVNAIAFDERGHAWIGTSGGLSVFDGETWTTYTADNSGLAEGPVLAIAFDEQGRAWIGTSSGLSILDEEIWTTYTADNSRLAEGAVRALAFDEQGRAWSGTPAGVSVFDGETWATYLLENSGVTGCTFETIAFDEQGRAWIGTHCHGDYSVSVFDGEGWITHTVPNAKISINVIAFDEQGRAWVGSAVGVDVFDGKTWTTYTSANSGLMNNAVRAIAFDEEGRVWIGGTLGSISVFSPKEIAFIPQPLVELGKYWFYFFCFSPVVFVVLASIWLIALLARGRAETGNEQSRVNSRLWLWWTLANTAGVVASYLMTSAIILPSFVALYTSDVYETSAWTPIAIVAGIASGIAGGAVSGVIQWLALRRHIPRAARWVSIGAVGFAASYAVTITAMILWYAYWMYVGEGGFLLLGCGAGTPLGGVLGAVIGIVGGTVRGLVQRLALRRHVPRSARWIPASSVELAIGLIAVGANVPIIFLGFFTLVGASGFLIVVASGAVGGAITGRVLARLLQTPAETSEPEEDTAPPPQNVDSPTDEAVQPPGEEEVE